MTRLAAWVIVAATVATAQAEPLRLEDVAASVRRHPTRDIAAAAVARSEADRMAAEGAFDPRIKASGLAVPVGHYERYVLDTSINLPTKVQGITPYAGYRIGDGEFAIYDYKQRTLEHGELRAGVDMPLLQGRSIDNARAKLEISQLDLEAARAEAMQIELELLRDAAIAYWDWVAAGHRQRIRDAQLAIARNRIAGLSRRVDAGDVPRVELTDNERVILSRRSALAAAERDLAKAALTLSVYLRDAQGVPRAPTLAELPPLPAGTVDALSSDPVKAALAASPALVANERRVQAAQTAARAAENLLLPKLDFSAFISRDFGDQPDDLLYQRETELGVGVLFELPIGRHAAKGAAASAAAAARRLSAERRLMQDRLGVAVSSGVADLTTAIQRAQLAVDEAKLASDLAAAERTRFEQGDGTILIVNLREEAAADAESGVVDSVAEVQRAEARLGALMGRRVAQ